LPDTPSDKNPVPASPTPDPAKAERRVAARARRRAAHAAFGARIGPILTANFMAAFSLAPRAVVAGYNPINDEADVVPLMTALGQRGHALCLPAVVARDAPLAFRAWSPGAALVPGPMGILEPPADAAPSAAKREKGGSAAAPSAAKREKGGSAAATLRPDVVLVPLLAFDGSGHRLGYGGGYYDRTLAQLRAEGPLLVIGVAYSAQEVDSLPGAEHDQRLDAALTERGIVRFARKAPSPSKDTA
jgi:5-formyltetrahydrofolate cyclo-ligase